MHHPLVGERVWVSGCCDEYIVAEADYATGVATIFRSGNDGGARRGLPFSLLFAHDDFKAAQDGLAPVPVGREVLRSSRQCIHKAYVYMVEMREAIQTTMTTIRNSQALIAESNRVIARSQTLDCSPHPLRTGQNLPDGDGGRVL